MLILEFPGLASVPSQQVSHAPLSVAPALGLHTGFYVGAGELTVGSHARVISTLGKEPSPGLCRYLLPCAL